MSGLSNCWSAGENSSANPVTGVVTRKNESTGITEIAAVKPVAAAPETSVKDGGATLSSATLAASSTVAAAQTGSVSAYSNTASTGQSTGSQLSISL